MADWLLGKNSRDIGASSPQSNLRVTPPPVSPLTSTPSSPTMYTCGSGDYPWRDWGENKFRTSIFALEIHPLDRTIRAIVPADGAGGGKRTMDCRVKSLKLEARPKPRSLAPNWERGKQARDYRDHVGP
jgi:hypothetical protein